MTDYYKWVHLSQYDQRISKLVSYFTPRSGRIPGKEYVINFGIQAFCKEYLIDRFNEEFFRVSPNKIEHEIRSFLTNTLPGINVDDELRRIMDLHKLRYLPISLRTLPEGCKVSMGCPCIEIVTTHPNFPWIGGFIESLLSSYIWKPMIDATVGHWYREIVNKYYEMAADDWQSKSRSAMSEFGFRGADSPESGVHSGAAWLLSFNKTATCAAIPFIREYYNMRDADEVADVTKYYDIWMNSSDEERRSGCSVDLNGFMEENESWHCNCTLDENGNYITALPLGWDDYPKWMIPDSIWNTEEVRLSINGKLVVYTSKREYKLVDYSTETIGQGLISTEHSVMCSQAHIYMDENGVDQREAEKMTVHRLLTEIYPHSSFSMVSDSYDYWRMVTEIIPELKDEILGRYQVPIDGIDVTDKLNDRFNLMRGLEDNKECSDEEVLKGAIIKTGLDIQKVDNKYTQNPDLLNKSYFTLPDGKTYVYKAGNEDAEKIDDYILYEETKPATLFVRGDSGDPIKIVAGYIRINECLPSDVYDNLKDLKYVELSLSVAKLLSDKFSNLGFIQNILGDIFCVIIDSKYYKLNFNDAVYEYEDRYIIDVGDEITEAEAKGTVECLWDTFGGSVNSKGYKVLDPHIRAIYGDSITQRRADAIYTILIHKGFSPENVALGAGSFSFHAFEGNNDRLYPYTRDTMGMAAKVTYGVYDKSVDTDEDQEFMRIKYNGKIVDSSLMIYKDPKTNNNSDVVKKSMRGCCAVYRSETDRNGNCHYYLDHDGLTLEERENDTDIEFTEIFKDGKMTKEVTFTEIRNNLNNDQF